MTQGELIAHHPPTFSWNSDFKLRDYQREACRATTDAFGSTSPDSGETIRRQLLVAATGAGKTVMAAAIAYAHLVKHGGKILFLADTNELINQARKEIAEAINLVPTVEKGQRRANRHWPVVVSSIQTMSQRVETWPPDHFSLVIADEAHLSMAETWQKVLNYWDDRTNILGITATPERADKQALLDFYQSIPAEIKLFDLIERGHLAPIVVKTLPIEIDATSIKKVSAAEQDDVEAVVTPYYAEIIQAWKDHGENRKTLVFHPTIKASRHFVEMAQSEGIAARHVDGQSPDREMIIEEFARDQFTMLSNSALLIKGFNDRSISCIMNLRLTKFRGTYQQIVGRGTRTFPGKENLLLLDFLWQFATMGIVRPGDLVEGDKKTTTEVQRQLESGLALDLGETCRAVNAEREEAMIAALKAAAKRKARVIDALQWSAILHFAKTIDYEPTSSWDKLDPTPGQLQALEKQGVDPESVTCRGHAHALLDAMADRREKGLATPKQVMLLARFNVNRPETYSFDEASRKIDSLLGGWKKSR